MADGSAIVDTMWAVARHEAGHAVMAVVLGVPIRHAMVVDGAITQRGQVLTAVGADRRWDDALISAAGLAVEPFMDPEASAEDRRHIVELTGRSPVRGVVREARNLLLPRMQSVDAVAAALLDRGWLSGNDVVRVVAGL